VAKFNKNINMNNIETLELVFKRAKKLMETMTPQEQADLIEALYVEVNL
jgi:hypothetical protein